MRWSSYYYEQIEHIQNWHCSHQELSKRLYLPHSQLCLTLQSLKQKLKLYHQTHQNLDLTSRNKPTIRYQYDRMTTWMKGIMNSTIPQ
jgi:hypothetical protein